MPLLSPEVPSSVGDMPPLSSFGDLPALGDQLPSLAKDAPPVLFEYGEEDACDQASDKSEGDSGKENEEEISIAWRGSKTSVTSRSSRPRSGPFNQLNNANPKVVKQTEKKSVLGEANSIGRVTRSGALNSSSNLNSSVSNLEGTETKSSSLVSLERLDTKRTPESPIKVGEYLD